MAAVLFAGILTTQPPSNGQEDESNDISIRGIDPKNLPFDKIITVDSDYTKTILYDRASEGDSCFITCNNYNGVTSKWSNYYVDLQPFENFCLFLTGCSSQYPIPSSEVRLIVDEGTWQLKMSDPSKNRYYLPLEARQALANRPEFIQIEISGIKMPIYRIGQKNVPLIGEVVNTTAEIQSAAQGGSSAKSKEERLIELQSLKEKGLISPEEFQKAREKIIID